MSKRQKTKGKPRPKTEPAVVSMTGFGRATGARGGVTVEVEIKSVNSRFLDCAFRLAREYSSLEPSLRDLLSERMHRGRVEFSISRNASRSGAAHVRYDKGLFVEYLKSYRQAIKDAGSKSPIDARMLADILARREVLDVASAAPSAADEEELVLRLAKDAITDFVAMRAREGGKLAHDLTSRLRMLHRLREQIAGKTRTAPEEQKRRLQERLEKLLSGSGIDETRLCTEAAYLADRLDVSEELVRLESHLQQFEQTLGESPNGRKLEFLLQEFGREFNTISSKAQDAAVQQLVVEAKTEIEKIREQVQNVE